MQTVRAQVVATLGAEAAYLPESEVSLALLGQGTQDSGEAKVIISRTWAMPNLETFSVKPIGELVRQYLQQATVSVDPFARNKRWATHTNDLNPATEAEYHMEVVDYLNLLVEQGVKADLLLFDPPYSPRQVKECYNSIGRTMTTADGQSARLKKLWRQAAMPLLADEATVISCGWNSVGFGVTLGFEIVEILMVCHGGDHNDTIVTVERKL